jgi:hypothetical protein
MDKVGDLVLHTPEPVPEQPRYVWCLGVIDVVMAGMDQITCVGHARACDDERREGRIKEIADVMTRSQIADCALGDSELGRHFGEEPVIAIRNRRDHEMKVVIGIDTAHPLLPQAIPCPALFLDNFQERHAVSL